MRSSPSAVAVAAPTSAATLLSDYKELLKPGITAFVVVMAASGYLLAATGPIDWAALLGLMAGTALTGGGAAALNHVVERDHDARMARTAARPLPSGRMAVGQAVAYAVGCVVLGALLLALTTNALTTGLSVLTVFLYVGVYTPLKRRTVHNTIVGAVPGALPALGGAAAATGALDAVGWSLFAILFLWQLPHFYALAWMLREDYARAGFRMLPDGGRTRQIATLVLGASVLLLAAGVLPAVVGQAGLVYAVGMAAVGAAFVVPAVGFFAAPSDERARRLLLASIAYVPAFFVLVVADFLLR